MKNIKSHAIRLRQEGYSLPYIHNTLRIPKSTLSGWLRNIELTAEQKIKLEQNRQNGLKKAREGASKWHQEQKKGRLRVAKEEAISVLEKIDMTNIYHLELNLAILYLAEGSKKNTETALGSSDPQTLNFFLFALEKIYGFDRNKARYELYIRADQDGKTLQKYWSKELSVPLTQFKQVSVDKRSKGATFKEYMGVCSIRCGSVAIQRRLVYLAKEYFAIIAK